MFVALVIATAWVRAQDGYIFTTYAGQPGVAGSANGLLANARFKNPDGLAVDAGGSLVIVDTGNLVLRKVVGPTISVLAGSVGWGGNIDGPATTARFGFALPGGGPSTGFSNFSMGPRGVLATPSGMIYVVDSTNSTIRTLSSYGSVATLAGSPRALVTNPVPGGPLISLPALSRDGVGVAASFGAPLAITVDAAGNLYVSDTNVSTIRKITPAGVVTTYAGIMNIPGADDGPRGRATFRNPAGVAMDSAGNLFVVDSHNYTIRRISVEGEVSTLAGSPGNHGSADGIGSSARLGGPSNSSWFYESGIFESLSSPSAFGPTGIAIDGMGNLFVADTANHTIRKVTPTGAVSTIGGLAGVSGRSDGVGRNARFLMPLSLTFDRVGNLYVSDSGNHTIRKGTPVNRPQIQTHPLAVSASVGQSTTLSVTATSIIPVSFQWTKSGTPLPGATSASLVLTNLQVSDTGAYAVTVSNDVGSEVSAAATVGVGAIPIVTAQPSSQTILGGQTATLVVTADGTPLPTFQWRKDGVPIVGATNPSFLVAAAQATDAGIYTVVATNDRGSVTSSAAAITVNTSRIINLSIRSALGSNAALLTVGFVVSGNDKNLLVRGVGPTLAQFGLANALGDPRLALFAGDNAIAINDNWGTAANAAQVSTTASQVGAFALNHGSNDAALLSSFEGGTYSAQITGPTNANGIVLVELYDANVSTASRLVNVSTRALVGTGDSILVAGFVVSGNTPKKLLIRAIGPTLAIFGVTGPLADPRLEIIGRSNAVVASNDNWAGSAELTAAFAGQGAFPLSAADSKDAALLVTLEPGSYSAQVSGVNNTTGEALIEIYEVR
jgi:sugar lactone lactonase YvrE